MESRPVTLSVQLMMVTIVVVAFCVTTSLARVVNNLHDNNDVDDIQDSLFQADETIKRDNQEDISKLLLKHLRFRQLRQPASLPEAAGFPDVITQNGAPVEKRQEQRMLVNNLAALLSGLRDRKVESSMRMPSLRFGK